MPPSAAGSLTDAGLACGSLRSHHPVRRPRARPPAAAKQVRGRVGAAPVARRHARREHSPPSHDRVDAAGACPSSCRSWTKPLNCTRSSSCSLPGPDLDAVPVLDIERGGPQYQFMVFKRGPASEVPRRSPALARRLRIVDNRVMHRVRPWARAARLAHRGRVRVALDLLRSRPPVR